MSNVETVQAMYDAFGRGDIAAIIDQLADDVEWDRDAPGYGVPIYEPGTGRSTRSASSPRSPGTSSSSVRADELPQRRESGGRADQDRGRGEANRPGREALEIHLWTFGEDGKVSRFFHCIDRHAIVLAYGLA